MTEGDLGPFSAELMAESLYKAHDPRIYQLFRSDRWLLRRVTSEDRDWAGYETDLSQAFRSLERETASDLPGLREAALRLIRLCLVQATLTSSEDIPDAVLLAAVQQGIWPGSRAAATIQRYPDADRQAAAYVSLLSNDIDEGLRRHFQEALLSLAFIAPDRMPSADLTRGISLLDTAEVGAVADRLSLCEIAATSPAARWRARADGRQPGVTAANLVTMMVTELRARRPALVKDTIDVLLGEAARISRDAAAEYRRPFGPGATLDEVASVDSAEIAYGDYLGRPEVLMALARAAWLVSEYPEPERLPAALAECMGCAATVEEWATLCSAYEEHLPPLGIAWQPPEFRLSARYASAHWAEDQNRLWFLRQMQLRTDHADLATSDDEEIVPSLTVEVLQSRWIAMALEVTSPGRDMPVNSVGGPPVSPVGPAGDPPDPGVASPEPEDDSRDLVADAVKRATAPIALVLMLATGEVSPEDIDALVPAVYDGNDLNLQLYTLESAAAGGHADPDAAHLVMGALLCHALRLVESARGQATAWAGLYTELIEAADLTPVTDYVLSLPAEPERGYASDVLRENDVDLREIPLLNSLKACARYLDEANALRIMEALLQVQRTQVRNRGLELLISRLPRSAVETVMRLDWRPADAREEAWVLRELAAGSSSVDTRTAIEDLALEAASGIKDGWSYVDAVLHTRRARFSAAEALDDPQVLKNVRLMSTNDRTDALRGFSHHADRDPTVPTAVFEEILSLPATNRSGAYSWRGIALITCSSGLDEQSASRALDSAMEIPERLTDGSSEAWGRDWTNEFLRAAVVNALIPVLPATELGRTFDFATTQPFQAREPLFRTLAARADADLAARLFDHALARYAEYAERDDPSVPRMIEGAVTMTTAEAFHMQRQVQTAELVAMLVEHLDPERRRLAADLAMRSSATGPCAWLGSIILDHLRDEDPVDAELLTGMALVDAQAYVLDDPTRMDLLVGLMRHVQRYAGARLAPLTDFIRARFPDYRDRFLDAVHGETLSPEDLAEYKRLTGFDKTPRVQAGEPPRSELELRVAAADWILSPFGQLHRERVLQLILQESPIIARISALPRLTEVLSDEFSAAILGDSLRTLVSRAEELDHRQFLELATVAEQFSAGAHELFLDVVRAVPGFDADPGGIEAELFRELYLDQGGTLRSHPKYDSTASSVAARMIGSDLRDKTFAKSLRFETPRVAFIAEFAKGADPGRATALLPLVRAFPELERACALAALLEATGHEEGSAVIAEINALRGRFAHFWALFRSQNALGEEISAHAPMAESVVASFDTPTSIGAAAYMLIGYLGRERTTAVLADQVRSAADDADRLKLLSLIARIADAGEARALLLSLFDRLSSSEAMYRAALMSARAGVPLADHLGNSAPAVFSALREHLVNLAQRPRAEFLRELAGESDLISSLVDDTTRLAIAKTIRRVCAQWRWP